MKLFRKILLLVFIAGLLNSCFSDLDDNLSNRNVKEFIWKGMNYVYLYKDFKPDLADDRFETNEEFNDYLGTFSSPEELFDNLLYDPENVDEFSFLVDDYIALEQFLSGTTVSNGMEFGLRFVPGSNTDIYGYVRYVLPNTIAETNGVQRGDIFYAINDTPLTTNNYLGLIQLNNYSINLATYDNNGTPELDDDTVTPGTQSIPLSKSPYTEDPIYKTAIIDVDGNNVGYLMYNGFTSSFNTQLNNVFSNFQSSNITDLVLDLRYNSGGSVNTAISLGSMITGQFNDEVFSTEEWNSDFQTYFEENEPESLINRFVNELSNGSAINSLNLDKVYILTTGTSASASELVINSLKPYIEVVQIGTTTRGKYQASTTLYDSPNFSRQNANPNHTYAIQPLIFKSLNKDGVTDYNEGLEPTIALTENSGNLGVLGDENEPLLAEAIAHIQGSSRISSIIIEEPKEVGDSKMFSPIKDRMYSDKKLPIRN